MIAEAFRRRERVYHVALHLDPDSLLPAAAFELVRKALEGAGKILALHPEKAADIEQTGLIEVALSSAKPARLDSQALPGAVRCRSNFRSRNPRAANAAARSSRHPPRIRSRRRLRWNRQR